MKYGKRLLNYIEIPKPDNKNEQNADNLTLVADFVNLLQKNDSVSIFKIESIVKILHKK
jgi:hypothetical protein